MKLLICISNVPDTTTKIRFTDNNSRLDESGIQWIINPWDELALTRAMELKDAGAVNEVHVINVGPALTEATLRKALAVGADKAFRIDAAVQDGYQVAALLAAWLKEHPYDMVLTGIESSDFNSSGVGVMVAELAGLPCVPGISGMEIQGGDVSLRREIEGGQQQLSVKGPFLAIVQKGIAKEPRIPSMRGIMMARSKPLEVVQAPAGEARLTYLSYTLPQPKGACRMVDPEQAGELIRLLHEEAKVI